VSVLKDGSRSSDHKPTIVKVINERSLKVRKPDVKQSTNETLTTTSEPVGILIDSPNSNVRIQGSKIEVKEKPSIKRDLSEVILKVPDPSKFMTSSSPTFENNEAKKPRIGSSSNSVKQPSKPSLSLDKQPPIKTCEHKKESEKGKSIPPVGTPNLRRRPERSAKKRAKDSISEITEAERPHGKDDLRDRRVAPLSPPPHRNWREMRSPPAHVLHGREMYMDYYPERSPPPRRHSPDLQHRAVHSRHSPIPFHRYPSPEHRSRSPPIQSVHRPLSPPVQHRHTHSPPPRHLHNRSPHFRDHDDHRKHFHYTEPLSPRYRGTGHEPYFYYSERSRSPYLYEYHHEKERLYEELERRSPPIKHRRLSPVRDLYSPVRKHDFIHVPSESISPRSHHSPGVQEGRFPYGRVDWDSPRYRHDDGVHSPSIRSSPIDPQIQYQPLSRMPQKDEHKKLITKSPARHNVEERTRRSRSPLISPSTEKGRIFHDAHHHPPPPLKRIVNEKNSPPPKHRMKNLVTNKDQSPKPVTAFEEKTRKSKSGDLERPVIEIPEETGRVQNQRKTPTRKKGLGLLEMKIQGLKSKMQQTGISEKIKEKVNSRSESSEHGSSSTFSPPHQIASKTKLVSPMSGKTTKSLSDVISSLSQEKGTVDIPDTKSGGKRSKSLADITKNLAKSLEKNNTPEPPHQAKELHKTVAESVPIKPKISAAKLSDVISTLKEKSKAASAQLPTSKFKDINISSSRSANDSKLLDILKRGTAGKSSKSNQQNEWTKELPLKEQANVLRRKSVISPVPLALDDKSPTSRSPRQSPRLAQRSRPSSISPIPSIDRSIKSPSIERSMNSPTIERSVKSPTVERSVKSPTIERSVKSPRQLSDQ